MSRKRISRRKFVADSSMAAFGAIILPRHLVGGSRGRYQPPSATLNFAVVGCGGQGRNNAQALIRTENMVAMCDVDFGYVERQWANSLRPPAAGARPNEAQPRWREQFEKATRYADFREMLEKQRDIDAVVIATPDHSHAAIAAAAMKAGKHVFVQKPLTYSVYEARLLARLARETKVATQMGNQGHSREGTRRIMELIKAGIIGPVREVHIFTNRPVNYWAQGLPRPVAQPDAQPQRGGGAGAGRGGGAANPPAQPPRPPQWNMAQVDRALRQVMLEQPLTPPDGMSWPLWLGPAPDLPYHPAYHPFTWRGWVGFGVGALGDMGAHLVDQPYWALGLSQPTSIVSSSSPWGGGRQNPASYPLATTTQYEFAARGDAPPVKMFWYDSGLLPPRPPFLPDNMQIPNADGGGGIFVGEKGILTYGTYGDNPQIWPESLRAEADAVPKDFARVTGSHELNWAQACKGESTASSPFEYSAALTETMLLGVAALHANRIENQNGKKLLYDAVNMKFTNYEQANQFLTREYRAGWEL
jgi:predicted dehydrogenase